MKVKIIFNTEDLFNPMVRGEIEKYFRREQNALTTCEKLGWSRTTFEEHLCGIFAKGNSEITVIL